MIPIDSNVARLIEKYIDLIEANKWEDFYASINHYVDDNGCSITPKMTKALLAADVDPLPYLKKVPMYYFCDPEIEILHVPDHIQIIERNAYMCSNLKQFHLPANLKFINFNTFSRDVKFFYPGTKKQFIDTVMYVANDIYLVNVKCSDDSIHLGLVY